MEGVTQRPRGLATVAVVGEFSQVRGETLSAQLRAFTSGAQTLSLIVVAPPAVEMNYVLFLLPVVTAEVALPSASRSACEAEAVRRALSVVALASDTLRVSYRIATSWKHALRLLDEERPERTVIADQPWRIFDRRLVRRAGLHIGQLPALVPGRDGGDGESTAMPIGQPSAALPAVPTQVLHGY